MTRLFEAARSLIAGKGAGAVSSARPTAERRVVGRLVTRRGDELTLEVTVDDPELAWRTTGAAEIVLADGSTVSATILADPSTREGTIPVGATLRIVLRLPGEGVASPETVTVAFDLFTLIIVL
jgi:hypothetical protein